MQPYATEFIPQICNSSFPKPIMELYNPDMLVVDYISLLKECEDVFASIKVSIGI